VTYRKLLSAEYVPGRRKKNLGEKFFQNGYLSDKKGGHH
jgi:hypothetical protein